MASLPAILAIQQTRKPTDETGTKELALNHRSPCPRLTALGLSLQRSFRLNFHSLQRLSAYTAIQSNGTNARASALDGSRPSLHPSSGDFERHSGSAHLNCRNINPHSLIKQEVSSWKDVDQGRGSATRLKAGSDGISRSHRTPISL